jgi:transposase
MVTDQQITQYRKYRQSGKSEEEASARLGMTAKTARKWEAGPLPSQVKKLHRWRTRTDPLKAVWGDHVLPLLQQDTEGRLQAPTIIEVLNEKKPEVAWDKHLRTLQRQLRVWRATEGPAKEVMFPQDHPPGQQGSYDFTHAEELDITINGMPFPHLLFQYIMAASGERYVELAFAETYEALSSGLQNAFWTLGGVPTGVVRHDNLSAATHELKALEPGRKLTPRYAALLHHYGVGSSRIEPGKSHQNGIAEKGHDVLKTRLDQLLIVRGHRDFDSVDAYKAFFGAAQDGLNKPCAAAWAEEKLLLRALPSSRIPSYTEFRKNVSRWSIIRVRDNGYSVPSRLIGEEVTLRVHPDTIDVLYRDEQVDSFPRLHGQGKYRIDYRHIIESLVRKPGAFVNYRFREELYPSLVFRKSYDALVKHRGERAHVDYVRILYLAATQSESDVALALELLLAGQIAFDFKDVEGLVKPHQPQPVTAVKPLEPVPAAYNNLLSGEFCAKFQNNNLRIAS